MRRSPRRVTGVLSRWTRRPLLLDIIGRLGDYLWMTQVTTAEAAERLGISQRQVQRVIARGDLPAHRTAGDAWVVDALALNALS